MSEQKEQKKTKTVAGERSRRANPRQSPAGKPGESKGDKPAPRKASAGKPAGPARLHAFYRDAVVKDLTQKFGYKSVMQVPRIDKIVLNMGVGEAVADKKIMDNAVADMTKIAGQKPLVTKSRKAIASFKIRENYPVGCKVTLRGARMYDFLDRLVNVAMPRIRDFRGISARKSSTAWATTTWASKSRSFSRRSSTTRLTRSGA